jgi:hypothetical protein
MGRRRSDASVEVDLSMATFRLTNRNGRAILTLCVVDLDPQRSLAERADKLQVRALAQLHLPLVKRPQRRELPR